MRKYHCIILTGFALALMGAAPTNAQNRQGPVTLKEQNLGDKPVPPIVTLGRRVTVSCNFYITDFFGEKVISAGATLNNAASVPMYYSYNVAFFDKEGKLVGCSSQTSMNEGLKPGEETQLGSCLISVPAAKLATIKTYQVSFYESDKKVAVK